MTGLQKLLGKEKKKNFHKVHVKHQDKCSTSTCCERLTLKKAPWETIRYFGLFLASLLSQYDIAKKSLSVFGIVIALAVWKALNGSFIAEQLYVKCFLKGIASSYSLMQTMNPYWTSIGSIIKANEDNLTNSCNSEM